MGKMLNWLKAKDLGLTYEQAVHGVQTSIASGAYDRGMEPKHMRTGVDMTKADMLGLACLLIDKGVISNDEYVEYIRLSANMEVAMREEDISQKTGLKVTYR